jgi:hypothetical protein
MCTVLLPPGVNPFVVKYIVLFPQPSLNMANKNIILSAIHGSEICGPWLTADLTMASTASPTI